MCCIAHSAVSQKINIGVIQNVTFLESFLCAGKKKFTCIVVHFGTVPKHSLAYMQKDELGLIP